nr:MAG TPA: hypothetical protein [Caudoviricetes sp.]
MRPASSRRRAAFLRLLDRAALMATGRPIRMPRTPAVVTWPETTARAEMKAQTMLRVATQVIRVVVAPLGAWVVVFIWFLLGRG